MNWEHMEGRDWEALGATLRARWAKLTAVDLEDIAGQRETLVARLQTLYGLTELRADAELRDWERHQRPIEATWPVHDP